MGKEPGLPFSVGYPLCVGRDSGWPQSRTFGARSMIHYGGSSVAVAGGGAGPHRCVRSPVAKCDIGGLGLTCFSAGFSFP